MSAGAAPDGWSTPARIDEVDARSSGDPARIDPYVEHWFWLREREAGREPPAPGVPRAEVAPPRAALPWPRRSDGRWRRTVLRGLLLAVLARLRAGGGG